MERTEIHNLIALPETPSGIRFLLIEFVKEFESQNSIAWNKEVKATNKKYHCHTLLKKGIGKIIFNKGFTEEKLSRDEISCLFNYYYFPIVFDSAYLIFNTIWDRRFEDFFINNNALIFIDLGADLIASSIAFGQIYKDKLHNNSIWDKSDVEKYYFNSYVLINESNLCNNRQKLTVLNRGTLDCQHPDSGFEYEIFNLINNPIWPSHEFIISDIFMDGQVSNFSNGTKSFDFNYYELKIKLFNKLTFINENYDGTLPTFQLIEKFDNNKCFLININFIETSRIFDNDNIYLFFKRLFVEYKQTDFAIIFQNNGNEELQNKWDIFKSSVAMKSIKSGVIKLTCNSKIHISYEVLFRSKYERYNYY